MEWRQFDFDITSHVNAIRTFPSLGCRAGVKKYRNLLRQSFPLNHSLLSWEGSFSVRVWNTNRLVHTLYGTVWYYGNGVYCCQGDELFTCGVFGTSVQTSTKLEGNRPG